MCIRDSFICSYEETLALPNRLPELKNYGELLKTLGKIFLSKDQREDAIFCYNKAISYYSELIVSTGGDQRSPSKIRVSHTSEC